RVAVSLEGSKARGVLFGPRAGVGEPLRNPTFVGSTESHDEKRRDASSSRSLRGAVGAVWSRSFLRVRLVGWGAQRGGAGPWWGRGAFARVGRERQIRGWTRG